MEMVVSDILGSFTSGPASSGDRAHMEVAWEEKLRGGVSMPFKSTWVNPDMTEIKGVFETDNSGGFAMHFSGGKQEVTRKSRDQALFANFRQFHLHQPEAALELADFGIECRGGEVVRAHRILLAVHSSFFQGFFRRESKSSVRLDYESLPVQACLDFLFTGEVDLGREELGVEVGVEEGAGDPSPAGRAGGGQLPGGGGAGGGVCPGQGRVGWGDWLKAE